MSDPSITIEQMRAERDAARQEADQSAALVGELREKIAGIKSSMEKSKWKADCDHGRSTCESIGCNGQYFAWIEYVAGQALSTTPPAALERVQRESAAREAIHLINYWDACPDVSRENMLELLKARVAELREGK